LPHRIALYGRSGSGKSLVSKYLAESHGFRRCSTGEICRAISEILFGDDDRGHLNLLSEKIREIDPHLWIKAALSGVADQRVVFESVRYPDDVTFLKPAGFAIWNIDCSVEICNKRLLSRGQSFNWNDIGHPMERALEGFRFDAEIDNGEREISDVLRDIDVALGI
jgi:dephospho-CoA kinase